MMGSTRWMGIPVAPEVIGSIYDSRRSKLGYYMMRYDILEADGNFGAKL
jgi:hypothetical protein